MLANLIDIQKKPKLLVSEMSGGGAERGTALPMNRGIMTAAPLPQPSPRSFPRGASRGEDIGVLNGFLGSKCANLLCLGEFSTPALPRGLEGVNVGRNAMYLEIFARPKVCPSPFHFGQDAVNY